LSGHRPDPLFPNKPECDFVEGKGKRYIKEQAHGGGDDRGAEAVREAGRKAEDVAREVGVSKHTIYAWKGEVRRDRCEPGPLPGSL